MAEDNKTLIEGDDDFTQDAKGWHERWSVELRAAEKVLQPWRKVAKRVIKKYLMKTGAGRGSNSRKLGLWPAVCDTLEALLYDKTPVADVSRRFDDSGDPEARVAALMLERIVNQDIERKSDTTESAFALAVQDRLQPGFGMVRVRYICETESVDAVPEMPADEQGQGGAPEVPAHEKVTFEDAVCEYHNWADCLWSPCRTFQELRWFAFGSPMSMDQVRKRFGKRIASKLDPVNGSWGGTEGGGDNGQGADEDVKKADPLARVTVWEVWSKEHKKVFWFVKTAEEVLDQKDDPLELEGFWPFAEPLISHPTTSGWIPEPDYTYAQDQYEEVDELTARIGLLQEALAVKGVYDKSQAELQRLLGGEAGENQMIACDNWALLAEKGGLKGVVDWFPLEMVSTVLQTLGEQRQAAIELLFQVTGQADIMRGQAATAGRTATETRVVARASGVRPQRLQSKISRFVSDTLSIKAEVVAKHFQDETIIARSNILRTPDGKDPQLVQAALKLLRDEFSGYRIQVRPDDIAQTDFDKVKSEKGEFVEGLAKFLGAAAPLMEKTPQATPLLLEMLKVYTAGYPGASSLEGILDKAIEQATKAAEQAAAQPPPPSPEEQKAKAQMQLEQQKAQLTMQTKQQESQLKAQEQQQHAASEAQQAEAQQQSEARANDQERQADFQMDMATMAEKHRLEVEKLHLEHSLAMQQAQAGAAQKSAEMAQSGFYKSEQDERSHKQGLEQSETKHKQDIERAKAKPAPKGKP